MLGFLKKRRELREAQTKIGIDLHRQILNALEADDWETDDWETDNWETDDHSANKRLSSTFTAGYIYAFVRGAFMSLGIDAEKDINTKIRYICDGVIPVKLYKIFSNQAAALALARQMDDQHKKILNTGLSPAEVSMEFAMGIQAGTYDAPLVSIQSSPPDNLRRFLLKETLRVK